jgi:hypothetical protein
VRSVRTKQGDEYYAYVVYVAYDEVAVFICMSTCVIVPARMFVDNPP